MVPNTTSSGSRGAAVSQPHAPPPRLLRLPEVELRTGLKKSAIYAAMKDGLFPPSVKITRHSIAWPEAAISAWIDSRMPATHRTVV